MYVILLIILFIFIQFKTSYIWKKKYQLLSVEIVFHVFLIVCVLIYVIIIIL